MKKRMFCLLLIVTMPILSFSQNGSPTGLMCNLLAMPERTVVVEPMFGWIYHPAHKNDAQTAWHILVADSKEDIDQDVGTLWDSGTVTSF